MPITFDGVTLTRPRDEGPTYSPNEHFTITCFDVSDGDISAMQAKYNIVTETVLEACLVDLQGLGDMGDLVIGTTTYTDCMITDLQVNVITPNYGGRIKDMILKFARHTAG